MQVCRRIGGEKVDNGSLVHITRNGVCVGGTLAHCGAQLHMKLKFRRFDWRNERGFVLQDISYDGAMLPACLSRPSLLRMSRKSTERAEERTVILVRPRVPR